MPRESTLRQLGAKLVHSASRLTGTGGVEEMSEDVINAMKAKVAAKKGAKKDLLTRKFVDRAKDALGKRASAAASPIPPKVD